MQSGDILHPDNFSAVVANANVGRYPYGIKLSADGNTLLVSHVGVFEYAQLRPTLPQRATAMSITRFATQAQATRKKPKTTAQSRSKKLIPVTYRPVCATPKASVAAMLSQKSRITSSPGLGSPNDAKSSSVYALDVSVPTAPKAQQNH